MGYEVSDMHIIDNYPDAPRWRWQVNGTEETRGTMERPFAEAGLIQSETAGAALDWLINHGPIWDCLDTDREFIVTVRPETIHE